MAPASALLRLLAFTVPVALAVSALQPLLGTAAGQVPARWSAALSGPCFGAATLLLLTGRATDVGSLRPPWYSAWILLPGAFLLAGAASMCLVGALVQVRGLPQACWLLLAAGGMAWGAGMVWVRRASR